MEQRKKNLGWTFTDKLGSFEWDNPHPANQLYFPLCNEAGMMSSVTPKLNGDAKVSQYAFLMQPVSIEDLHNSRAARNFWIYSEKTGAYSLTGNSARQTASQFTDGDSVQTRVMCTFLSHTLIREDAQNGIKSEITLFCPNTDDTVELMLVRITNTSDETLEVTPTTAIPIFGRSADNLRDHRHATSLMHRMKLNPYGLSIKPTMHHDERDHEPNNTNYFVLAVGGDGEKPAGLFPTVSEFIGDSGFDWPEAVVKNLDPYVTPPHRRDGMEAIGAMRFQKTKLQPGQNREYIVISGITDQEKTIERCIERYGDSKKADAALKKNHAFWAQTVQNISFESADSKMDQWMRWVALQPTLRKIFGCSFLPHHDYGRGGRGWRDLWQDYLALLLQNPAEARAIFVANFAGVRTDGSNATIILKGTGNFAADRNKVSRVWMDHGVWPYFSMKLYIDQTGDFDILFEENSYWKDTQIKRAKDRDNDWDPSYGNAQKTVNGEIYKGSLLEHLLLQNLTCFHNVGDFNNMKLEDADWNDQLDMANDKGESVPFTAFYAWNLLSMSELLLKYKTLKGVETVQVFKELIMLTGLENKLNIDLPDAKRQRLNEYFEAVDGCFSGEKITVSIEKLAEDLKEKGEWVLRHVREKEWIDSITGYGFFNGYYNNDGIRVDGDHEDATRMNLTAQTFAIMSGAATDEQVEKCYEAAQNLLKDENTGGYRLTTPLGPNTWNFGRGFALIYGEKETGGMFSHMAVMFMYALYSRGYVKEGYGVLENLYGLCNDTPKAKIYPGIPEYINHEGKGMYHYVTGSASWLLMAMQTQIFGIRGELGELVIFPKLVSAQFDGTQKACIQTSFGGKQLHVVYHNPEKLNYEGYVIRKVLMNGAELNIPDGKKKIKIRQETFQKSDAIDVVIEVTLGSREC